MQEFPEIGILHRRKIEAEIIKPIYEILAIMVKRSLRRLLAKRLPKQQLNLEKSLLQRSPMVLALKVL